MKHFHPFPIFIPHRLVACAATCIVLLVLFTSCEQLEGMLAEKDPVETPEEPEEPEVPPEPEVPDEPERPEWFDAAQPVTMDGDTIYVTASAVAGDSVDAGKIALEAVRMNTHAAFTKVISEMIEQEGGNGRAEEDTDRYIDLLTFDHQQAGPEIPYTETLFFHHADDISICYVRHRYRKSDLIEAVK